MTIKLHNRQNMIMVQIIGQDHESMHINLLDITAFRYGTALEHGKSWKVLNGNLDYFPVTHQRLHLPLPIS
jgi:hypothetical protein